MSENNGFNKRYEVYDRMSTESLNALLELEAQLDGNGELDSGTIAYIAGVIAKREKEAHTQTLPDLQAAWDSFQKNYLSNPGLGASLYSFDEDDAEFAADFMVGTSPGGRRIDLYNVIQKNASQSKPRKRLFSVSRIAAAIAILCLMGSVTALAVNFSLDKWIAHWTGSSFTFIPTSPTDSNEQTDVPVTLTNGTYCSLQVALDAYNVALPLAPKWIPDGYKLSEATAEEDDMGITFSATYEHEGECLLITIRKVNVDRVKTFEKDEREVVTYKVHDIEHYIMHNIDKITAVWTNDNYEGMITGSISKPNILKMIDSIYERS